ncbi:hypothetical protein [Streptomyces sp. NPDC056061]|uniref:hypothetical protein n=1 Tax=Streptomyces sp. NPDC056061 TaxID=3345700 RepID=UPI0035E334EE
MEPRDFWDRNTVLAEAFCASDERMRRAQALLDEAQAERSRTLAAFAVTVGDDGSIADLMGLNEREVRLARRTVGRNDARSLAQELLGHKPRTAKEPAHKSRSGPEVPVPRPRDGTSVPAPAATTHSSTGTLPPSVPPPPVTPPPPPPPQMPPTVPPTMPPVMPPVVPPVELDSTVVWSPSMDSVLLWSWESGLDVQTVAAELGLDVRALLMRVQELANDGLITLTSPLVEMNRSGRHRRQHEEAYAALLSPTATFPTHVPY